MQENSLVRVADLVASYISNDLGVETCFCVTGAGIMHLTDGLAKNVNLTTIFPHHEQSVSMAVDAFSRATGRVGVAMVSTGPAATNALTGLAGCWQDSVAALFISGQVKRSESTFATGLMNVRQFGVQELNILPIVEPITKFCAQVSDPEKVLEVLDEAVHHATTGRPGPVWVEIPMDVQAARVDPKRLTRKFQSTDTLGLDGDIGLSPADARDKLLDALGKARRPVILAGQGVRLSGQLEAFERFVSKHNLPVVSPYLGYDSLPRSHPMHFGVVGVKGERVANWAVHYSDLLVIMGSSMHVSVTGYDYGSFSPLSRKFVFDISSEAFTKGNVAIDEFFEIDLKTLLPALADVELDYNFETWSTKLQYYEKFYPTIDTGKLNGEPMSIYKCIHLINQVLEDEDIIVSDAGSAFYAVSQALVTRKSNQRYITSGAMATMGFSLPAAIGACFSGAPRVIAFTGDGSLQQNLQELSLMKFHELNLKLIVLNNDGYLSIRASQNNYFEGRMFGTDDASGLPMPDLRSLAEAFCLSYIKLEDESSFGKVAKLISQRGPLVVDVSCPPNEPIVPTLSSFIDHRGIMQSPALNDMTPRLSTEDLKLIEQDLLAS